jgi:hypothetical protein
MSSVIFVAKRFIGSSGHRGQRGHREYGFARDAAPGGRRAGSRPVGTASIVVRAPGRNTDCMALVFVGFVNFAV